MTRTNTASDIGNRDLLDRESALDELLKRITEDASVDPKGYLEDTIVPEGGE